MNRKRTLEWISGLLLVTLVAVSSITYWRWHHERELNAHLALLIKFNDMQGIRQLLKDGADIRTRDAEGRTVLFVAAFRGDPEMVALAIQQKLDVNASDRQGMTPLMTAAWAGAADCVSLLLNSGAQVNARNREGGTALLCSVSASRPAVVRALLDRGAAVDFQDRGGRTALQLAEFAATVDLTAGGKRPSRSGDLELQRRDQLTIVRLLKARSAAR